MATYRLAYKDHYELKEDIWRQRLRPRSRCEVKIESGKTKYVFVYMGAHGDQINGLSALNGRMIIIDPETMTLIEK